MKHAILLMLLIGLVLRAEDPLFGGMGLHGWAAEAEKNNSCIQAPPPAPPAQHSSAEGFPPLPLPAVPLRRTEKKNPPRPPVLIAKIATAKRSDWATNPADTRNLLRWMASKLNVHFSEINLPASAIPSDPQSVPVLYRTGHDAFSFTPQQRAKLAAYLRKGGTIIFEACCGRAAFAESALREMRLLIPERPPYRLPPDHPLFHSYFHLTEFGFRPQAIKAGAKPTDPGVIGIDVECRTAALLFRWDVSCGWDEQPDTEKHHCIGYDIPTARKLGANLMSYVTSERSSALPMSQAMSFQDATKDKSGTFAMAQVKYGGIYKTREAGLSMLLNYFHEQTKTPVTFEREEIDLTSPHLFDLPLIYMTGHLDFHFSTQERTALARYLRQGGVLLAESCCGRTDFTRAFLQEIQFVLPEARLTKLPPQHLIFSYPNKLTAVQARPQLAAQLKNNLVPPELYAISINGHLAVIFSPHGIACGWELAQCPYCKGYAPKDSLALGINILSAILLQ